MNPLNKATDSKWILLVLAGLCSLPAVAMAEIHLGGQSFTANGEPPPHRKAGGYQYTGSCPVNLQFDWGIVSSDPVDVVYSFERNDGGQAKPARIALPGSGQSTPIHDGWSLGANTGEFADFHGWIQLDIRSPYPLSYRMPFTLHCVAGDNTADQSTSADATPGSDASADDGNVVQASDPPPPLPDYDQPPCPVDGNLWTPGYWGYAVGGYFWVPGTWVAPPQVGLLWTPGYWGFVGGRYGWHGGYWGPHVGFYGGVNYGFGYGGHGFFGGRWNGAHFAYNTSITHVNTTIVHNTYRENITVNNVTVNRTSFNGGPNGIVARPTIEENVALKDIHVKPNPQQLSHFTQASKNLALYAKTNAGHPSIAATSQLGAFHSPGVVPARGPAGGSQVKSIGKPMIDPSISSRPRPEVASTGRGASATETPTLRSTLLHPASPPPSRVTPPATHVAMTHPTNSTPSPVPSSPPHVSETSHPAVQTSHPAVQTSPPAAQTHQAQTQKKEPSHK
jgi:hypothetical protein